jgi:hypothetical protein
MEYVISTAWLELARIRILLKHPLAFSSVFLCGFISVRILMKLLFCLLGTVSVKNIFEFVITRTGYRE